MREEEALDGYYVLLTSEIEETDDKILDVYRGLWRIEESFKVTKSDLEARPVYIWTKDHIEAHFLTCFVALTIARILETKLERKYSIGKLWRYFICFSVKSRPIKFEGKFAQLFNNFS